MTRADQIKRAWADFRGAWPRNSDGIPMRSLRLMVLPEMNLVFSETPVDDVAVETDVLEFTWERGFVGNLPAVRVICEGVPVYIRSGEGELLPNGY